MKTAEEVAEEIYQKITTPKESLAYHDPTLLIAQALTAYADERVKEAFNERVIPWDLHFKDMEKARAEALEEAANLVDWKGPDKGYEKELFFLLRRQLAAEIRALKGTA